jgi:hypothetical protein
MQMPCKSDKKPINFLFLSQRLWERREAPDKTGHVNTGAQHSFGRGVKASLFYLHKPSSP